MKFNKERTEGGKNFLKLKSGESVRGVFRGDIYEFRQHFEKAENKGYLCTEDKSCQFCNEGKKSSFRFRLNIVITENGAYSAKIYENGWGVYEMLKTLHEDYNLETHLMKITRNGSGTDTTYSILPVPNGQLGESQTKLVSAVPLLNLEMKPKQNEETEVNYEEESIPF